MEECRLCSAKILLLVFLFTFVFFSAAHFHLAGCSLLAASIPHFLISAMKFLCFSPTKSSSFSVIHVSVDKSNVEKDSTLLLFFVFLSKSPGGYAISCQKSLELHLGCHTC